MLHLLSLTLSSHVVPISLTNFGRSEESETFSRNVESRRLNAHILSLKCDTKLSETSWNHLLIRSVCCASDAVSQAGLANRLKTVNLPSKLFDTVSFSWLLAMAKWWIRWMRQNKVSTVCAKFWSVEVFFEGLGSIWSTFFLARDLRVARILMKD